MTNLPIGWKLGWLPCLHGIGVAFFSCDGPAKEVEVEVIVKTAGERVSLLGCLAQSAQAGGQCRFGSLCDSPGELSLRCLAGRLAQPAQAHTGSLCWNEFTQILVNLKTFVQFGKICRRGGGRVYLRGIEVSFFFGTARKPCLVHGIVIYCSTNFVLQETLNIPVSFPIVHAGKGDLCLA